MDQSTEHPPLTDVLHHVGDQHCEQVSRVHRFQHCLLLLIPLDLGRQRDHPLHKHELRVLVKRSLHALRCLEAGQQAVDLRCMEVWIV